MQKFTISLIISPGNVTASEENYLCCVSCQSWKINNCSIAFPSAVLNMNRTTWKWIKYSIETDISPSLSVEHQQQNIDNAIVRITLKWEHNNSKNECTHGKSGHLVGNVLSFMTNSPMPPNVFKMDGWVSSLLCTMPPGGLSDQLQIYCECRDMGPMTAASLFTHDSKHLLISDAKAASVKILNFSSCPPKSLHYYQPNLINTLSYMMSTRTTHKRARGWHLM